MNEREKNYLINYIMLIDKVYRIMFFYQIITGIIRIVCDSYCRVICKLYTTTYALIV